MNLRNIQKIRSHQKKNFDSLPTERDAFVRLMNLFVQIKRDITETQKQQLLDLNNFFFPESFEYDTEDYNVIKTVFGRLNEIYLELSELHTHICERLVPFYDGLEYLGHDEENREISELAHGISVCVIRGIGKFLLHLKTEECWFLDYGYERTYVDSFEEIDESLLECRDGVLRYNGNAVEEEDCVFEVDFKFVRNSRLTSLGIF